MTGLSLVFILISLSILYVVQLIYNKSFFIKMCVITYMFLISSGIYFSFDTYKGWPSSEKLEKGYLIASLTIEPSEDDKGAIYYWAMPEESEKSFLQRFLSYSAGTIAPRSFSLPYSKQAADKFSEANEKLKQGYIVEIGGEENDVKSSGGKPEEGEGDGSGSGEQEDYNVPHFKIIPPNEILRKAE